MPLSKTPPDFLDAFSPEIVHCVLLSLSKTPPVS